MNETYIYDFPEWTQGVSKGVAGNRGYRLDDSASTPRSRQAARRDDDEYYDNESEEEFTPNSGWYQTGGGESVYCMAGEGPDHTACDSGCGYCGRCTY